MKFNFRDSITTTGLAIAVALAILCIASVRAAGQQAGVPTAAKATKDAATAKASVTGQAASAVAGTQATGQAATPATPAAPLKRLADGHPDFNGFWESSAGVDTPVGGFGRYGAAPRRKPGDNGAAARLADPNQPPYKPELMAKVKQLAATESNTDPAFFCKPGGVPRIGPPHGISQSPGNPILFLYQVMSGNTFRIINVDGRPHDPNADSSYYGDSIGHWEGDTLVVDTTNMNEDTWLGIDGWFHSGSLHVVERLTREGELMRYQATVEDPKVFTRPWTMNPRFAKATTEQILENAPCVESDSSHIVDPGVKTRADQ